MSVHYVSYSIPSTVSFLFINAISILGCIVLNHRVITQY